MTPLPSRLEARAITRASGSSFAPAFRLLALDRREDLELLYAFCRVADDIADAPGAGESARAAALAAWREAFADPQLRGLPDNLREMVQRRGLEPQLFLELLDGTATDLGPEVRMPTCGDLELYCHRVAGTVGQLCLPIFGADRTRSSGYAETLGRALQFTNILRDTASDLARGRLYYPLDGLRAAGLDADNFAVAHEARRSYLVRFATLANDLFKEAARTAPVSDRRALRPAFLMAAVYRALLRKMGNDDLRVMKKRYRLNAVEKVTALLQGLVQPQ